MLTSQQIKVVKSLQSKKFRYEQGLFVAEGDKLVSDLLQGNLTFKSVYHTVLWAPPANCPPSLFIQVSGKEMERMSGLVNPSSVLATIEYPNYRVNKSDIVNNLTLALDDVQDPGNVGTILRLADWFGIDTILCSHGTADAFAPKVVQASMGSVSRVKVVYCNLLETLMSYSSSIPIYGAFMDGANIYNANLQAKGIVVLGNEGSGICPDIEKLITQKISIPSFASGRKSVESLNVAMASAIICSEFRRRV
jgi:RNA methyltransferase, TrmH family